MRQSPSSPTRAARSTRARRAGAPATAAAIAAIAALAACASPGPTGDDGAAAPDWVTRHGTAARYPSDRYVTGYGVATGANAVDAAKQQAAADLARKLLVHIESEIRDVQQDRDGAYRYRFAALTRSTADLRVSNLSYAPPYARAGEVHALAWIERAPAAAARAQLRDRSIVALEACLAAGDDERRAHRTRAALRVLQSCRLQIAEALQHDAVASALRADAGGGTETFERLARASRRIDREVEELLHAPADSLAGAAEAMALQLVAQGVSTGDRVVVSHFSYGSTNLSSRFGRQAGLELERALARAGGPPARGADLAVRGVYLEEGDRVRLTAVASEVETARLVASAESDLPRAAVPAELALRPENFTEALETQRVLSDGELVSGDLRVETWTNKGRGGVLFTDAEELRVFLRVNQPAWIRLLYVLTNGAKVPLDQGYYIDSRHVNRVVEYPARFAIQPPYGVEMLHATAFTEEPPPLATRRVSIAGREYEVLADGLDAVVRTRGLARRERRQIAEDVVTVTTTPR